MYHCTVALIHYCITARSHSCTVALSLYCIIAFLHSWIRASSQFQILVLLMHYFILALSSLCIFAFLQHCNNYCDLAPLYLYILSILQYWSRALSHSCNSTFCSSCMMTAVSWPERAYPFALFRYKYVIVASGQSYLQYRCMSVVTSKRSVAHCDNEHVVQNLVSSAKTAWHTQNANQITIKDCHEKGKGHQKVGEQTSITQVLYVRAHNWTYIARMYKSRQIHFVWNQTVKVSQCVLNMII